MDWLEEEEGMGHRDGLSAAIYLQEEHEDYELI